MYSTCIHCHAPLGANDAIELCPIGRRLAFDSTRGRLWVVCARCREWNLTPIEERWEAIEDCERRFRGTRLRASTDQIGLARLKEGAELVRIGTPLQPELAAWRYGAEFKRRRTTQLAKSVAFMAPMYAVNVLWNAQLMPDVVTIAGFVIAGAAVAAQLRTRWRPRVVLSDGRVTRLETGEFLNMRLDSTGDSWALRWRAKNGSPSLSGKDGERALRSVLAKANAGGGREAEIRGALELLDQVGGGEQFLNRLAAAWPSGNVRGLSELSPDVRLALEMVLHEEAERHALDGELAALDTEWRLAEEIAAIADGLFVGAETKLSAVPRASPGSV